MAREEVPAERRERAGLLSGRFHRVAAAGAAGVPHPLDGRPGRDAGLSRQAAAVGVLRPADHVRELGPLDGVDVDRWVPAVDLFGADPEEERGEARHHEALDVVGAADVERLPEDVGEGPKRVRARHGPVEAAEVPGVRVETAGREVEDLARRRVGREGGRRADQARNADAEALAARGVEGEGDPAG